MNENLSVRQQCFIISLCGENYETLAEKAIKGMLTLNEIDGLCGLISNEFMLNGITEDFEPNEYGRELEELLDVVNRSRVRCS